MHTFQGFPLILGQDRGSNSIKMEPSDGSPDDIGNQSSSDLSELPFDVAPGNSLVKVEVNNLGNVFGRSNQSI